MEPHVTTISRSVCMSIRNIGHIRKYLDKHTTEILVHAFITSKIDMGNSLLFDIKRNQLKRLQRLQNIAARLVSLTSKYFHITPVLQDLHWLPISYRIQYKLALFIFQILHNNAPKYLINLIHPYTSAHTGLRSSELMILQQPRTSTLWGKRSFSVASPSITTFKTNKISPVQTSILTQSSVLICLSLLKRHERLPEADTSALLSVLYY